MVTRRTCGGSEADAYRYTKKVLSSLSFTQERLGRYVSEAETMGESSWTRHCFNNIRRRFFHNGVSDIRFAPGVARIAYGELDMDDDWEDDNSLLNLDTIIRMISEHHRSDYNRHLNNIKYEELDEMFGVQLSSNLDELKKALKERSYGPRRYKIIWMENYQVGQPYYQYTTGVAGGSWCYLNGEGTFKSYTKGGSTKLYLALMEGFENITPDDPEYGPSMLGIDIGPNGELIHVNNRWNHAHDSIDERKGDNKYTAEELSDLLGGPYFEICPPYTETELLKVGFTKKRFSQIFATAQRGTFTDPRDGRKYHTIRLGNCNWIVENIKYIGHSDRSSGIHPDAYVFNPQHIEYGPYYNGDAAKLAVPPGCRLPSKSDWQALINFIKLNATDSYFFGYLDNIELVNTTIDNLGTVAPTLADNEDDAVTEPQVVDTPRTIITNNDGENLGTLDNIVEGDEEITLVDDATGDMCRVDMADMRNLMDLHDIPLQLTNIDTNEQICIMSTNAMSDTNDAEDTEPTVEPTPAREETEVSDDNRNNTITENTILGDDVTETHLTVDENIGITAALTLNHTINEANITDNNPAPAQPNTFSPWRSKCRPATNRCKMNLLGFGALNEGVGIFNIFESEGVAAFYWGSDEDDRMDPHSLSEPQPEDSYDAESYYCTYTEYERKCSTVKSMASIEIGARTASIRHEPKNTFMCVKCIVND